MKKTLSIAYKDLIIVLNDRAALIFMLLAPFLLTLGMGAVTGSFNQGGSTGMSAIPVVIVNHDEGKLGQVLVDVFTGEQALFDLTESTDLPSARDMVDEDTIAAVVSIPPDFSKSFENTADNTPAASAPVEIYTNPNRPISSNVVRSVVSTVLSQMEVLPVSVQVGVKQLAFSGRIAPQNAAAATSEMAARLTDGSSQGGITIQLETQQKQTDPFNYMSYLTPAMAIFFLMYTVTQGARSILAERDQGTLSRMLVSPTGSATILGGKLLGIFVTGFLQVYVLIVVSTGLFRLQWGDPLAIFLIVAATVLACTGWGILLASVAKQSWQVSTYGSALMLLFGLLGGTFISVNAFNDVMRFASKITPHAWANDAFLTLGQGGTLTDVLPDIAGLLVMATLLFGVAVVISRRRWSSGFVR